MTENKIVGVIFVLLAIFLSSCDDAPAGETPISIMVNNLQGDAASGFVGLYQLGPLVITAATGKDTNVALQLILDPILSDINSWSELGLSWNCQVNSTFISNANKGSTSIIASGPASLTSGYYNIYAIITATTGAQTIQTTLHLTVEVSSVYITDFELSSDEIIEGGDEIDASFYVYNNTGWNIDINSASLVFTSSSGSTGDRNTDFNVFLIQSMPVTVQNQTRQRLDFSIMLNPSAHSANSQNPVKILPIAQTSTGTFNGTELSIVPRAWQAIDTLPQNITGAMAGTIGNYVYLLGGLLSASPLWVNGSILRYNPQAPNPHWTSTSHTLQTPVFRAGVVSADNTIYIVGGYENKFSSPEIVDIIQTYDGNGNTKQLGFMKIGRAGAAVAYYNNALYIFGGIDSQGQLLNSIEKFDLQSNTSTTLSTSLPTKRVYAKALMLGEEAYIPGGADDKDGSNYHGTDVVIKYDFSSCYELSDRICYAIFGYAAGGYDDSIWIAGGIDNSTSPTDAVQRISINYPDKSGCVGALPVPLAFSASTVCNGELYVIGGQNSSGLSDLCYKLDLR